MEQNNEQKKEIIQQKKRRKTKCGGCSGTSFDENLPPESNHTLPRLMTKMSIELILRAFVQGWLSKATVSY